MRAFLLLLLSGGPLVAATTGTVKAFGTSELTLWELLLAGGWVMLPLLAVSVLVLALILFSFLTLRRPRVMTPAFARSAEMSFREAKWAEALEAAKADPQALARVVEQTMLFIQSNPTADANTVREVAQAEGNRQAAALVQQATYLMDLGVLAPMLGLFGTVIGILRSFGSIASEATPMRTMLLAGGVSQALVATAAGLIVGITAMFFYSYFRGCVQRLISELESAATPLIAQIGLKLKGA